MATAQTPDLHQAVYQAVAETAVADPPDMLRTVKRGVELLDREHPGWADKIDLRKFDLKSSSECVIGQVFGEYEDNVQRVVHADNLDGDDGYEYGFNIDDAGDSEEWHVAEDQWRRAIEARQLKI